MPFLHRHASGRVPAFEDECIVIHGDRLLARPDVSKEVLLPRLSQLSSVAHALSGPMHIGESDGLPVWLFWIEGPTENPTVEGWQWQETRSLLSVLNPAQSHAVSCARQLLWWERRHRFCGACGTPTVESEEERARRCPKCSAIFFPVASAAVIVAVSRGDELLLAHNKNFRPGMFSILAGFVDPGETLEQAVQREVREEVGIEITDIQYVTSQPWSYPNSLMLGFRARHLRGEITVDGKEIEQAAWFRREDLPDIPPPGSVARALIDKWRRDASG